METVREGVLLRMGGSYDTVLYFDKNNIPIKQLYSKLRNHLNRGETIDLISLDIVNPDYTGQVDGFIIEHKETITLALALTDNLNLNLKLNQLNTHNPSIKRFKLKQNQITTIPRYSNSRDISEYVISHFNRNETMTFNVSARTKRRKVSIKIPKELQTFKELLEAKYVLPHELLVYILDFVGHEVTIYLDKPRDLKTSVIKEVYYLYPWTHGNWYLGIFPRKLKLTSADYRVIEELMFERHIKWLDDFQVPPVKKITASYTKLLKSKHFPRFKPGSVKRCKIDWCVNIDDSIFFKLKNVEKISINHNDKITGYQTYVIVEDTKPIVTYQTPWIDNEELREELKTVKYKYKCKILGEPKETDEKLIKLKSFVVADCKNFHDKFFNRIPNIESLSIFIRDGYPNMKFEKFPELKNLKELNLDSERRFDWPPKQEFKTPHLLTLLPNLEVLILYRDTGRPGREYITKHSFDLEGNKYGGQTLENLKYVDISGGFRLKNNFIELIRNAEKIRISGTIIEKSNRKLKLFNSKKTKILYLLDLCKIEIDKDIMLGNFKTFKDKNNILLEDVMSSKEEFYFNYDGSGLETIPRDTPKEIWQKGKRFDDAFDK